MCWPKSPSAANPGCSPFWHRTNTPVRACEPACFPACLPACLPDVLCECACMCTHTHQQTLKLCKYCHTHTYTHARTCISPHTRTHTYTQTRNCVHVYNPGSFTCAIWGLCKLTWQFNLTSYNLSSDLNRGKRASWQVVKLTSLSSGSCRRKCDCHLRKKFAGVSRHFFLRIAIASKKVFARFFGPFFACCSLSKKRVFGWTRCEIWPWHNPPSTSFSRYKQSRSDTGSTQKIGINKERESERSSHPRRRTSQWSFNLD